jgi:quinol monooxygenase YgiN
MTRLLFRTQFVEGSRERVLAIVLAALPGLRALNCVHGVTAHVDRNEQDVVWAVWEFRSDEDMFALQQEPLYQEFLAQLRPLVATHGVQTHVLVEVTGLAD